MITKRPPLTFPASSVRSMLSATPKNPDECVKKILSELRDLPLPMSVADARNRVSDAIREGKDPAGFLIELEILAKYIASRVLCNNRWGR